MRRSQAVLSALAVTAALLVTGGSAAAAEPQLVLSAGSVGRGDTLRVTPSQCQASPLPGEFDENTVLQSAQVILVVGSGANERLAAAGDQIGENEFALTVPGWVDPTEPAVVAGWCAELRLVNGNVESRRAFTYTDVPVDITPGSASAPAPAFTLDRTVAAGGQVLRITTTGCGPEGFIFAAVFAGSDRSGRTFERSVAVSPNGEVLPGGVRELALSSIEYDDETGEVRQGPLPEGDYTVLVGCGSDDDGRLTLAEPMLFSVQGTFPSGDITVADGLDDAIRVSGGGCVGGRDLLVTFRGYAEDDELLLRGRGGQGLSDLADGSHARIAPGTRGDFSETVPVTPETDGSWTLDWTPPDALSTYVTISADCGDPFADGFRYVGQDRFVDRTSNLWTIRISPTASPTDGAVTFGLEGSCDGTARVRLTSSDGRVVAESAGVTLVDRIGYGDGHYGQGTGVLTAPSTAGSYLIRADCDDAPGYPQRYEVFAPTAMANAGPLTPEPTTGWPSSGERETYAGRIGPITLRPDMGMEEMEDLVTEQLGRAHDGMGEPAITTPSSVVPPMGGSEGLPSSQIGIEVPRPSGDFAITSATFDLVDANDAPVPQTDAHLHHFVVSNVDSQNQACPGSTFGLPGEIIAASGAERTALSLDDPYGIVVKESDQWFGVYDVMNRTDETKTVYLSYDLTIRRDVENVRPIHTYFGSATGCGSFTWDIDGSGTPDTQSTYVSIAKDGVMVGTGAHIHNGGSHATMTDDRGRQLCRSDLKLGESHGGHGGHGGMEPYPGYVPEFYPDDPEILGITNCKVREQVRKGERLRFDAIYTNERARSSVMGIYTFYVWEGGGPATPKSAVDPGNGSDGGSGGGARPGPATGARPVTGRPNYAG